VWLRNQYVQYRVAGNTPDTEAFMEAIRDLNQRFNVQRVIVVGDCGMIGKRTLDLHVRSRVHINSLSSFLSYTNTG